MILFIIVPLLPLFLMLPVARMLSRSLARTPPADGTSGPWCLRCSYALAGLTSTATCPECGGSRRFEPPSGSPHAWAWVWGGVAASVLSHAPLLLPWLAGTGSAPALVAPIALEAFFVAAVLLILARRVRGRVMWMALTLLLIPQLAADSGVYLLLRSNLNSGGMLLFAFFSPALQYMAMPIVFILVGTAWAVGVRRSWRRLA